MKMINLFFSIFLLSACTSNNTEKIDLKDYFWKVSDYETPKVLVYNFDSVGSISTSYYLIKKTNENELLLTRFDKNFNEIQYLKDLYKTDGVYLIETSFVEDINTKLITKSNISKGYIFPFNDFKSKMYVETSFDMQLQKDINISNKDSWSFEQVVNKKINNKDVKTLVAKGMTERIMTEKSTGRNQTIQIKLESWYSKGIGITLMKQEAPIGAFIDTYIKTITIDEFNKLKK